MSSIGALLHPIIVLPFTEFEVIATRWNFNSYVLKGYLQELPAVVREKDGSLFNTNQISLYSTVLAFYILPEPFCSITYSAQDSITSSVLDILRG